MNQMRYFKITGLSWIICLPGVLDCAVHGRRVYRELAGAYYRQSTTESSRYFSPIDAKLCEPFSTLSDQ